MNEKAEIPTVLRKLYVCPNCGAVYARKSLRDWPGCSGCGTTLIVLGFVAIQDDLDEQ